MKKKLVAATLAGALVVLSGVAVWAASATDLNAGVSGNALKYETGEEELRTVIPVGQIATASVTRCNNCFFEGFINMGNVVQVKKINGHTFRIKGLMPGDCVINLAEQGQSKVKVKVDVKVVAR
jgi:hypothetical protein